MQVFVRAGPAEILRSAQKDNALCEDLEHQFSEILLKVGSTRTWLRYRHLVHMFSQLLYYGLTTLSGYQTLGEEYTGIVQVDPSLRYIPSFVKRAALVSAEAAGVTCIIYFLLKLRRNLEEDTEVPEDIKLSLMKFVDALRAVLPFIQNMHKALFYWNGKYYELSKRLLKINYIRTRPWLRGNRSLYGFKILSVVTILHLTLFGYYSAAQWWNKSCMTDKQIEASISSSGPGRCALCVDVRRNTSATPCGHLFCWNCILDWLRTNEHCPICRDVISPSRVIPLQNCY